MFFVFYKFHIGKKQQFLFLKPNQLLYVHMQCESTEIVHSGTIVQLVNVLPALLQHRVPFEINHQRLQAAMLGRRSNERKILRKN